MTLIPDKKTRDEGKPKTWLGAELSYKGASVSPGSYKKLRESLASAQTKGDFKFECGVWEDTLKDSDADILRRIVTLLKYCGLVYRARKTDEYGAWKRQIAVALSHGGRILVQLPPKPRGDDFWSWLTGQVTLCERTSTHKIGLYPKPQSGAFGQSKWVREETATFGKKCYGLNIALGGANKPSPFNEYFDNRLKGVSMEVVTSSPTGRCGHLLLVHREATSKDVGGVLIGIEGSMPGVYDALGQRLHALGGSAEISMAGGLKFKMLSPDFPQEVDCMFVDLNSNWSTFEKHRDDQVRPSDVSNPPLVSGAMSPWGLV